MLLQPDPLEILDKEAKGRRILAIDHNRWRPHVLTSFELLVEEALRGNECFYLNSCDYLPFKFGAMYPTKLLNYFSPSLSSIGTIKRIRKFHGVEISSIAYQDLQLDDQNMREQLSLLEEILDTEDHNDIRRLKYRDAQLGYAIVSSVFERLNTTSLSKDAEKTIFLEEAKIFMAAYDYSSHLYKSLEIDQVFIFNGRFSSERASWEAAKHLSVQVVIHEAMIGGIYTSNEFGFHSIDGYSRLAKEAWSKGALEERIELGESWFLNRRENFANENDFSESHSELELEKLRMSNPLDLPIATLFNTSDREFYSISPEWETSSGESQLARFYWAAEELIAMGYFVVLRLHPNMSYESHSVLDAWRNLKELGVKVLEPKCAINSYSLMKTSAVVVTAGSTTGVEATALGVRSILIGHALYEKLDCVDQCNSIESFHNLMRDIEASKQAIMRRNALLWGFYESSKWRKRRHLIDEVDSSFSDLMEPSFVLKNCAKLVRLYFKSKDKYFVLRSQWTKSSVGIFLPKDLK